MNGIVRNALRVATLKGFTSATANVASASTSTRCRSIWNVCNDRHVHADGPTRHLMLPNSCGCGNIRLAHSKAEKELVEFLAEEIVAEKKAQKLKTIPTELDGFKLSLDGAEVTLAKEADNETIFISFNVNHTVDTDSELEINPRDEKPDVGEMKSKPNFKVAIQRGKQTLGFACSFNSTPGASGADSSYDDIFGIDEITMYEGEPTDNTYVVAGEIIDGYLYDLLMNYLEEKGVSNEFAEKLIELSTNYEHTAYISLLEGLSKFTMKK